MPASSVSPVGIDCNGVSAVGMERAAAGENLGEKDLRKKILQIDKMRSRTREILTGSPWGQPEAYHLTVNTTAWPVKALVAPTATFIESFFRRNL
mgnify:CR=1 FL=1